MVTYKIIDMFVQISASEQDCQYEMKQSQHNLNITLKGTKRNASAFPTLYDNLCLFIRVQIVNERHVAQGSIEKVRRVQMIFPPWH